MNVRSATGVLFVSLLAAASAFVWSVEPAQAQILERISVDSQGGDADDGSSRTAVSSHGRYVAFASMATDLVPGDTNAATDIFVRDRFTGITTRVSVASDGTQGNKRSMDPAISDDGRFVTFDSLADNLVGGDANGVVDVFVHDRQTNLTELVSRAITGGSANAESILPSISWNGDYVAFMSLARDLVPGDALQYQDVFLWERATHQITWISVNDSGTGGGDDDSGYPAIATGGQFVSFESKATDLVPGDTNTDTDIFVRDLANQTTFRVSVKSNGDQAQGISFDSDISWNGRYVAFTSSASDLVVGDTNNRTDIFVHDTVTGLTTRVSLSSSNQEGNDHSQTPSISANGRQVAFRSTASNLVPGDTNGTDDVFVRDIPVTDTRRASVSWTGAEGDGISYDPGISADSRVVAFASGASNLVPDDTNDLDDVFTNSPPLIFEIEPSDVHVGDHLELVCWKGLPLGPLALMLAQVNGQPDGRLITVQSFDRYGDWRLSAQAPGGLEGLEISLMVLGLDPTGAVGSTNEATINFLRR